jgi:hypothetical protein
MVVHISSKAALVRFIGTSAVTIDCANCKKAFSPSGPKLVKCFEKSFIVIPDYFNYKENLDKSKRPVSTFVAYSKATFRREEAFNASVNSLFKGVMPVPVTVALYRLSIYLFRSFS